MKRYPIFLMLIITLFWVGCVEEQDINVQSLIGNWENSVYMENQGVNQVDAYGFDESGRYFRYIYFKDPEINQTLGYAMYLVGDYILEGKELVLKEERRLLNLGVNLYEEIEGLSEVEVIENTTLGLAFKSNGQILEMTKTCSPLLSSICIPVTPYTRKEYVSYSPI